MRVALLIAYDGTAFHGFARQRAARSVQGVLEERLSLLLRAPVEIVGAGRTDAGVHASGQVVSLEIADDTFAPRARSASAASAVARSASSTSPEWLRARLNKWLAPEVSVRAAAVVPDDFSARFSAVRREYEYRCYREPVPDPFQDRFALWLPERVSLSTMRAGARALVGEHDFSSFCRKGQGSMVRRVRTVRLVSAPGRLTFEVKADSFCHQMVRSIVGMLLDVGKSKREPSDVPAALGARDRASAGSVAPARALHLVRVRYRPDPFRGT